MSPISSGRASDGRYDVHEAIDDIGREVNMSDVEVLIPPPALVRERLARNVREARLLRSLLRLSVQSADAKDRTKHSGRPSVPRLEGAAR
jgi:hypothetical protein